MINNNKNTIFIALLLIFSAFRPGFAQTLWTEPALPTAEESITVFFDATGTAIEGYDGDLYAHTGVNLESDEWQYVIGDWGENENQPQLTRLEEDFYQLEITPSVYDFYDVPQSETIIGLAFVFRSEAADQQTGDLFADIVESGLSVSFLQPENNPLVTEGEEIEVAIQANQADSVLLEVDGEIMAREAGNELEYAFNAEYAEEKKWMVAIAKDATDQVTDSAFYLSRPEVTTEPLPDQMNKGVNYIADDAVTLVFQAPEKEFVYVIGDFNDWEINNDYFMKRDPDGEHYWLTIDDLTPQQQYIYQFFIDGELRIADPYTGQISNPYNDHHISDEVYPDLIEYPEDKTQGNAAVLQTAQEEYEWEVENFTPPAVEDMVVYECLVRDFTEEGTYAALTAKLDYLKDMGVNVLELMPVNEFEGNVSWGYNPSYYFAPDKAYGPREELKRLIDEAHKRGIAVFADIVLNHSYGQSPFVQMYFNNGAPAENNPWYNREHNFTNPDAQWGYDFDHESPYTQALVDSINTYWMSEYKVDGFRFDFTKGFTNNIKDDSDPWGSLYDEDRVQILKRMADAIWDFNPNAVVSFEHLAENSEETELANYGVVLWGNLNHNYNEGMMGWTEDGKSDLSWGSYQERGWSEPNLLTYMESHDEERLMYKALEYGNQTNPDHDIQTEEIALERAGLAASFLFTIPGPKMIWQFGELGYDYSIDYDCRTCPKPVRWDYLEEYRRKYLYDVYSALIDLKTTYEVFSTTDYDLDVRNAIKQINLYDNDMDAVVLGNFDVEAREAEANFASTGYWYEYITGDSLQVDNETQSISLQPGEYRIYTSEKISSSGLNVSVPEDQQSSTESSIFPNPSDSRFNILIETEDASEVKVDILDVQGRHIKTLFNDNHDSGLLELSWKPESNQKRGIYFLRISDNQQSIVKKLIFK